ncbi:MAG: dNTP triphosphohydrolase [Candidatus Competibacter sp.]|jgi:dGTPase
MFSTDANNTKEFACGLEVEADLFAYRLEKTDSDNDRTRNLFERDYARILYSSSFRRLQGKMQLLGVDYTTFYRNRLTHSLEVAQIARTIASGLGLKSPIVSEACALAHDIGNPPFGHSGEVILNKLANNDSIGGYEGNAQVIRIVRSLEKKYPQSKGLNLTVRTLLGLTKYFFTREENNKKYLYPDDYKVLNTEWLEKRAKSRRSIDVQIMDLSDEIAYAAHDLEDSLAMGYMSLGEILYEFQISSEYSPAHEGLRDIVKDVQKYAGDSSAVRSSEEYSSILRRELTSRIVDRLVRDIKVVSKGADIHEELGFGNYKLLSEGLKKLVFRSLLRKRNVQLYEKMGDKVIMGLYEVYCDKKFNKEGLLLPVEYRNTSRECELKRSIIDYISGMMDAFAIKEYKKYYGSNSLDSLYPVKSKECSERGYEDP